MNAARERSAGERVGAYELVRKLGTGAMGEVWEAILHGPAGFRKPVALKLLRQGPADEAAQRALVHEARLGALLQHPNVVGTYGLGKEGGTWHVALELVRGASVAELLRARGGSLPGGVVLAIGIQAAAGLAHVHDLEVAGHPAKLVHRDVKPANLLVDRTGLVKLGDLGICVLYGSAGGAAGTPGYMAPEQAVGRPERASDLFSLGAVLYVLATGRRPFGTGGIASRADFIEETSRAADFLAPVDAAVPGLGDVVRSCLRSDPADRPRNAREIGEALASLRGRAPAGPILLQVLTEVCPGLVVEGTVDRPSDLPTRILPIGNVRVPRDRFLGRQEELAAVEGRVRDGDRLVVLLGPGGMGKTRLGLEVARRVRHALPGGAWAFDLTEARSEDGICAALGAALSVQLDRRDPVGQLGRVLAGKGRALVMLDNLEQCVEHLPRTLGPWLDQAPEATFLATSRIAPGLVGERTVVLGPLAPADAVSLFLERASRPVTAQERPEVESLCDALEGLPLAIELAAARVKLLGVGRIRARLSLGLLSGGRRELPERHRSVEASLDWSADLLTPEGRAALGTLAVFDGGFTLEAAEAVLDDASAALGLLQELADASLLRVDTRGSRFTILIVVREYATSREPKVARAAAEIRHGAHFAQLGTAEAVAALDGPGGPERRQLLALELDNLVAACRRALARGDGHVAVATLRATWAVTKREGPFSSASQLASDVAGASFLSRHDAAAAAAIAGSAFFAAGRSEAAREHLERAVALHGDGGERRSEVAALAALAALQRRQGRPELASTLLERALALSSELGDRRLEGGVLYERGGMHLHQGRVDLARSDFERALAIQREVGDRRMEAVVLDGLGSVDLKQGRPALARASYEQALAAHRAVGDPRAEAVVLGNLGLVHSEQGQTALALSLYAEAIALARRVGDRKAEAVVLGNLAGLHYEQGRGQDARSHYEQVLAVHRDTGDRPLEGSVLGNLGVVHHSEGRPDLARVHFEQALAIHREVADPRAEAIVLANLGSLHLDLGRPDLARTHFEQALAVLCKVGLPRIEGLVLGQLALVSAREGSLPAATAMLERGEALLRGVGDPAELARLLASKAEVAHLAGQGTLVRASLDEAMALVGDGSEVRREIDRVRSLVSSGS